MTAFESLLQLIERVYPLTSKDPVWREIFKSCENLEENGKAAVQALRKRHGILST
jgi:hypothetical protein